MDPIILSGYMPILAVAIVAYVVKIAYLDKKAKSGESVPILGQVQKKDMGSVSVIAVLLVAGLIGVGLLEQFGLVSGAVLWMKSLPAVGGIVPFTAQTVAPVVPVVPTTTIPSVTPTTLAPGTGSGSGLTCCGNNPDREIFYRAVDGKAATTTNLEGLTVNVKMSDGTGSSLTGTTTNSAYNNSVTAACGQPYEYWVMPVANGNNGVYGTRTVSCYNAENKVKVGVTEFGVVQSRVYDREAKAFLSTAVGTDWTDLDASWTNTSTGLININADQHLDLDVLLRANETRTAMTGAKGECYVAADANTLQWAQPIISYNGAQLQDIKASGDLNANDLTALSNYEYAYKLPATIQGGSGITLQTYVESAAGIDPGAVSVKLRVLCKDYFVDDKDPNQMLYGLFRNDASRSEVLGSTEEITLTNT
jgi:hypothetical protein